MINLVNALKAEYGVDEVRVELARELKMSREERERMAEATAVERRRISYRREDPGVWTLPD